MNQDIKLSEQLKMDHESGDFGNALKGYSEMAAMLETLGNKVAQQEKQIQQLQMALADTEALEAGTAERCCRWRESHKMSQAKVIEKSAVIEELIAERDKLKEALEFCAGTSYIDDAHRVADEALKESA